MTKHEHEQETTGASGGSPRQEAIDAVNAVWGRCFSDAEKPADTIGHALAVHAELGIAHASALLHVGDQIGRLADELGGFHEARLRHALAGPKDRADELDDAGKIDRRTGRLRDVLKTPKDRADEHDDVDEIPDPRPGFGRFQDELRKARGGRRR